jgi:aldose sugar dehydrogenase
VHYWVPISIAPPSLTIETRPSSTEMWIGTLAGEMVVQLDLAGNCVFGERHLFKNQLGRIRDVRVDASGALYVLTDGSEGALYRVEPPENEVAEKTHL